MNQLLMENNKFLKMLKHLRRQEEVMLFGNMVDISKQEEIQAVDFLLAEYQTEAMEYPYTAPTFHPEAAVWAARTIYLAAQLMLYRENKVSDIENLLPAYGAKRDASAILSADLCLRFLPDIIKHLKIIDPEDFLIKMLEEHLITWHYSGVRYPLDVEGLEIESQYSESCLLQLYTDRIIESRRLQLAMHPFFTESVSACLGMFAPEIWNDFKPTPSNE